MNFLNKILITLIAINIFCLPTFAVLDIDASVDQDIRKKYNTNKIENDMLPALPNHLKNDVPLKSNEDFAKPYYKQPIQQPQKAVTKQTIQQPNTLKQVKVSRGEKITLKKGTKLTVRSTSTISDRMNEGTRVYFRVTKPITTKFFTMPANTRFQGVIVDSHAPQMTSNGGLIVIRIERIIINGNMQEFDAKITKTNYKNIYFNNIKGKHTYWANVYKAFKPEKRFYDKAWRTTKKLANKGLCALLSPFPCIAGLLVLGGGAIASPVIAIFYGGKHITIPADSQFEIKLLDDVTIYN